MNRTRLALAFGIAALSASIGFIACGSDDSDLPPDKDAAPDTNRPDGGGGGPDTGREDTGTDARPPVTRDPGQVSCGSATCQVPGQFCCEPPSNADIDGGCFDAGIGGATCQTNWRINCDEAADCPPQGTTARLCCNQAILGGGGGGGARVRSNCVSAASCEPGGSGAPPGRIACKGDEDCADAGTDAGTCVAQTCRGRVYRSCGALSPDAGCSTP